MQFFKNTLQYFTSSPQYTQVGSVPIYIHAARSAERPKMLNQLLKHGKISEPKMRVIHLQRTKKEAQTQRRQGQRLHSPRIRQSSTSRSPSNMTLLNLSDC